MKSIFKLKMSITVLAIVMSSTSMLLLNSCTKEGVQESNEKVALSIPLEWNTASSAGGSVHTTGSFSAIAAIQNCWGENVRFYGTIVNKVNSFTDANGTEHYTRHWTVKGLNAVGLITGEEYKVIGGAEMFTITDPVFNGPPDPVASGKIFIHQGTVVLENTVTGERVVARHVIKKNPKTGVVEGHWMCMGKM